MEPALRLLYRHIVAELESGKDVPLASVNVHRSANAVFRMMGDLTSATGQEVALYERNGQLMLRRGNIYPNGRRGVEVPAGGRLVAHTHWSGRLSLSPEDIEGMQALGIGSTTVVSPLGNWRTYSRSSYRDYTKHPKYGEFFGDILSGNF